MKLRQNKAKVNRKHKYKAPNTDLDRIKEYPDYIRHIDNPSAELRKEALSRKGELLSYIDNPSRDEIITAIEQNPACILYKPDLNYEYKLMALNLEPVLILYDIELQKYPENIIMALSRNPVIIKESKIEPLLNDDIVFKIVENNPCAISYVDISYKTEKLCKFCLSKDGMLLDAVPLECQTFNLINIALNNNEDAAQFVKKWDNDIATFVVDKNPLALSFVPKSLVTYELILSAVEKNGEALESVSEIVCNYAPSDNLDEFLKGSEDKQHNIEKMVNNMNESDATLHKMVHHGINKKQFSTIIRTEVKES